MYTRSKTKFLMFRSSKPDLEFSRDCYQSQIGTKLAILGALVVLLMGSILLGLMHGASHIDFSGVFQALTGKAGISHVIVWQFRLPRIIMAVLVGVGLATSGTICQAVLKNPLASPYTLGVASGAGFGAVLGIILGHGLSKWIVVCNAFFFATFTSLLILGISRMKNTSSETLILAGVAVMFLFSSLTSFLQYIGNTEEVHEAVFWFFGSLSKVTWNDIAISGMMTLIPLPLIIRKSWDYNAALTGDDSGRSLGVNVSRLRISSIFIASIMTAGAICFTGIIGFIGLVAPHITRMLLGSDHRFLILASAILGAILAVNADTISRTVWSPQLIPIGIVTSFLGVPFFLYLLLRRTKEYW